MTEQERLSREALLKRAAAISGGVYFAPILTAVSSSAVGAGKCRGRCGKQKAGKCSDKGMIKCFNLDFCPPGPSGAASCTCVPSGRRYCKCRCAGGGCGPDDRCAPGTPCEVANFCNSGQTCICFVVAAGDGQSKDCVDFPSNFCSDYPPCSKADGSGCAAGSCCLDTCCPEGICSPPCSSGAAPRISRSTGSGATLTI
jgi:hypothetical protein